MTFLAIHPFVACLIVLFLLALFTLCVWCLLMANGTHDMPLAMGASDKASNETQLQERTNVLLWLAFHIVALRSSVSYWLRFKRICAWHEPKPMLMGGNPFARKVTHGICPECFARVSAEIASHEMKITTA